jgi:hypothetical protein
MAVSAVSILEEFDVIEDVGTSYVFFRPEANAGKGRLGIVIEGRQLHRAVLSHALCGYLQRADTLLRCS